MLIIRPFPLPSVFARAEYDPARPSVEAVLDSSRYFVVRVEDSGKKAYIGLGFAERTDSFDFNVALQDYTKYVRCDALIQLLTRSQALESTEGAARGG